MKQANKPTKKREYFILEEWLPALQKLDGFSLLAIEFKKNTTGFVKQVKGQVFEEYEKYIGNIKVVEKHPRSSSMSRNIWSSNYVLRRVY